jgi:hypothetical protein
MKRIIFTIFVCCLFVQNVLAQSTDFRNQMNTIFGNVDLSQVSSGILFDYGLNLADDSLYNGTLVADNILLRSFGYARKLTAASADLQSALFNFGFVIQPYTSNTEIP